MLGIREEMVVFLIAVLSGAIVRLIYQCIRCFRRIIAHQLMAVSVEDVIFWIGSAVYMFVQIYHTSDGSIRWYFVLGVAIGAVLMSVLFSAFGKMHKKIYGHKEKDFSSGT